METKNDILEKILETETNEKTYYYGAYRENEILISHYPNKERGSKNE